MTRKPFHPDAHIIDPIQVRHCGGRIFDVADFAVSTGRCWSTDLYGVMVQRGLTWRRYSSRSALVTTSNEAAQTPRSLSALHLQSDCRRNNSSEAMYVQES